MLLLAFVVAVAFYDVLYFASGALSPHLGGATSALQTLRALIFHVPDANALLLLKEMLLLCACYIAFDFVVSLVRCARRPTVNTSVKKPRDYATIKARR